MGPPFFFHKFHESKEKFGTFSVKFHIVIPDQKW